MKKRAREKQNKNAKLWIEKVNGPSDPKRIEIIEWDGSDLRDPHPHSRHIIRDPRER